MEPLEIMDLEALAFRRLLERFGKGH